MRPILPALAPAVMRTYGPTCCGRNISAALTAVSVATAASPGDSGGCAGATGAPAGLTTIVPRSWKYPLPGWLMSEMAPGYTLPLASVQCPSGLLYPYPGATATACTMTFATAFSNFGYCAVSWASAPSTTTMYVSASSKTAFTITLSASSPGAVFNYACNGD